MTARQAEPRSELPQGEPRRREGEDIVSRLARPTRASVAASLAVAILAGGITATLTLQGTPAYESVAALIIDQPGQIAASGTEGVVLKLIRLREKYVTIARTTPFIEAVAARAKKPVPEIRRSLLAVAPGFSLVIFVSARDDDPDDVATITAAGAEELVAYVGREQAAPANNIPATERIRLSVVSPAEKGRKVSPQAAEGARAAGIAAGLALVATYGIVRATRRT